MFNSSTHREDVVCDCVHCDVATAIWLSHAVQLRPAPTRLERRFNADNRETVDWAGSVDEAVEVASDYELSVSVLELVGPGGGWPVIEVRGELDNLERFMHEGGYR